MTQNRHKVNLTKQVKLVSKHPKVNRAQTT